MVSWKHWSSLQMWLLAGCKSFSLFLCRVIQRFRAYFEFNKKMLMDRNILLHQKFFKVYCFKVVHLECPQHEHDGLHNKHRKVFYFLPHWNQLMSSYWLNRLNNLKSSRVRVCGGANFLYIPLQIKIAWSRIWWLERPNTMNNILFSTNYNYLYSYDIRKKNLIILKFFPVC